MEDDLAFFAEDYVEQVDKAFHAVHAVRRLIDGELGDLAREANDTLYHAYVVAQKLRWSISTAQTEARK
jgi:hypothetical protein